MHRSSQSLMAVARMFSRVILIVSGLYWVALIYLLIDSCVGARNCEVTPSESLLWATPAALVFWLPAYFADEASFRANLIRIMSAVSLVAFLTFAGRSGSFWSVAGFFDGASWGNTSALFLSSLPLLLLFVSLVAITVHLATTAFGRLHAGP